MKNTLGIIISFDAANDLREMTDHRTVASVPFGGRYRVIDFMLSNMVNADINQVGIVMRDKYQSLMDHIGTGRDWDLSRKIGGIIMLPPNSYAPEASWFMNGEYRSKLDGLAGIADLLTKNKNEYVLISDGDIVANICLDDVMDFHLENEASITAVCVKTEAESPYNTYFDVNKVGDIKDIRVGENSDGKCKYMALGIYLMKREFLVNLLTDCVTHNLRHFEREALHHIFGKCTMKGFVFNHYAVKIEDAKGYFKANMELLDKDVRDELFLREQPIYTKVRDEAPTYYGDESRVSDCLIADGCTIEGNIENSIIFRDVHIEKGCNIKNSIIMQSGHIGLGACLSHIIADKNVTIREGRTMMGHETYPVVIAKNSVV